MYAFQDFHRYEYVLEAAPFVTRFFVQTVYTTKYVESLFSSPFLWMVHLTNWPIECRDEWRSD